MRSLKSIVVVAALAVVAAGCGSSTDQASSTTTAPAPTPLQTVLAASQHTADTKTSRVSLSVTLQGPETMTMTGEGEIDYAALRSRFSVNAVIAGQTMTMDEVTDGATAYVGNMKITGMDGALPNSDKWVKVDVGSSGNPLGTTPDADENMAMLKAAKDVTVVGQEEVRGEKTTHYKAQIDFSQISTLAATDAERKAIEQMAKAFGSTPLPMDVWIDDANRVRRMTESLDMAKLQQALDLTDGATDEQVTGTMTVTMEFYDFGAPVNIQLPAADKVTTVPAAGAGGIPTA